MSLIHLLSSLVQKKEMQILIDLNNEINIKTLIYIAKLSLKICYINVEA